MGVRAEERRVVTVLFADLVGFTTLSETLDPEQVKRIVDRAFERLVRDVSSFGGRVDKIIGDAIVALFGAPTAHEDDAERAVRVALRMHETLAAYAVEAQVDIRMRIGVNTGEVLVGALRAGGDYTAMGDVVNIASRLQAFADPGTVVVGPATQHATRDVIVYESKGSLLARGREQPIEVYVARDAILPPGSRPRRTRTPLIGRDTELAVLENTLELSIRNGRAQQLLLMGEAGVGKTRLANEIVPMVRRHWPDAIVLGGRCVPYGEVNPWWPIAEALRSGLLIEPNESLEGARAKAESSVGRALGDHDTTRPIVNGVLHLLGYEGPLRGLEPARALAEATGSLIVFLEASVRRRPIIVRLADLHWADDVVLEFIDQLSERLARFPFVMVATARRSLLRRWSPRSGRYNSIVLNLDPLDRESASMLLDVLVDSDAPDSLRAELLDRSGGNPFYLEELVGLLAEGGHDAGTEFDAEDHLPGVLPDTLRGLVSARIDGLTAAEQLTIEDASVWGSSGPIEAIERLAQATRDESSIAHLVASLETKEILDVDGDHWSFRSDLVREVAYSRLTKSDRLGRHLGIAMFLEAALAGRFLDDSYVDKIARHFLEATRLSRELGPMEKVPPDLADRAVRWLSEAARRAEQSASWPLAERLYGQGLELCEDGDGPERIPLLLGRAHALGEQWRFGPARDAANAALHLADRISDLPARAQALLRLGEIEVRDGSSEEAQRLLGLAVDAFDAIDDRHGRAEARRLSGMAALFRNDNLGAQEPIEASLVDFRAVGDRRGEAWALQNLAWIAFAAGRISEAQTRLDESAAAFTEIGDTGGLAWAMGLLAFVRFFEGRFVEAHELASRIMSESSRRGDKWGEAMMSIVLGGIDLWEGRTLEALATAERAAAIFATIGDTPGSEQALSLAGRAMVMSGQVDEGLEMLDRAIAAESEPSPSGGAEGNVGMGMVAKAASVVHLGDPTRWADVEQLLSGSTELDRDGFGRVDLVITAALWLAQRGELTEAASILRAVLDTAGGGLAPPNESRGGNEGYSVAVLALVEAAEGNAAAVGELLERLEGLPRSTYLDRTMAAAAGVLVGLNAVAVRAETELASTGDQVARAILALAVATASGQHELSDDRWERLGVEPAGWRVLFTLAAKANV